MSRPRLIASDGTVVHLSKRGRIVQALLMPFPCRWNGWVREGMARLERLHSWLRGGDAGFRRRFCRDFGVCFDENWNTRP